MSKNPFPEKLTKEQSDALKEAASLVRAARQQAAAILRRVELPDDGFGFGNPCHAHIEGHGDCPCSDYTGDGGTCLTRITTDAAFPALRSCGHPKSKHFSTE